MILRRLSLALIAAISTGCAALGSGTDQSSDPDCPPGVLHADVERFRPCQRGSGWPF
jgi:hypothetical protein